MISLKYFFNPITIRRLPTFILSAHRRCLATDKNNKTEEIGPSAPPELQLNNLTGDHQRKERCFLGISIHFSS
jgi:hypothetical protein